MGIECSFGADRVEEDTVSDEEVADRQFRMELCGYGIGSNACDRVSR
jgi:hypothetical protein